MALELKQQIKLSQSLVMTPQLQQAIKLLQLSRLELTNTVQQELVENPVLEEVQEDEVTPSPTETGAEETQAPEPEINPDDLQAPEPTAEELVSDLDWDNYMESSPQTSMANNDDQRMTAEDNLTLSTSLADHLLWQLSLSDLNDESKQIGVTIIGNVDDNGYLVEELDTIAAHHEVELKEIEAVLYRVQKFDPVGVAARNLVECLLVQIELLGVKDPLVQSVIEKHLDLLQRKDYKGVAKLEGKTVEEVAVAAGVIGSLEPRPGRLFNEEDPVYITPDIYVHKVADEYHVVLNEDGMPKLRVSPAYRSVLIKGSDEPKETRTYVREKLRSAVWLIKSIHQRQRTIVKVMQSIIRFQRDFFDNGTEHLRPLNLRDVAEDIEMHESTVSRVTTNKYAQTPHGIFELKFFFNSSIRTRDGESIASESVKEKIREIIRNENDRSPLSDQRIAEVLRDSDIRIARRTVTKYREGMRILSSTRRRKVG